MQDNQENKTEVSPIEVKDKQGALPSLAVFGSYGLCHECGDRYEGTPKNCGKKECPY